MPPRKRATATAPSPPVQEPITEPTTEPTTDTTEPTETTDTNGNGTRIYSKRVTNEDVGIVDAFSTVKAAEVPKIVRDRGRTNQFDDPVYDSYQQEFASEAKHGKGGAWVSGHVANLTAAEKQARNSATYLTELHETPIGVEVRKLPDGDDKTDYDGPGVIYFRGTVRREKPKDTKATPAQTTSP